MHNHCFGVDAFHLSSLNTLNSHTNPSLKLWLRNISTAPCRCLPKIPITFENHAAVPARILEPLIILFRSWDDPYSDDSYQSAFTKSANLFLGPSTTEGHAGIKALRESMFNPDNDQW